MDLFDDKETFKQKVEDHNSINIPANLAWDKMGQAILEGVKKRKKRRRLLIWWWSTGIALIGFSLFGWWFSNPSTSILPTNSPPIEFQKGATHFKKENKIAKETTKSKIAPSFRQEKTGTQTKDVVNSLNSTSKRKETSIQSNSSLVAQVNAIPIIPAPIQLQSKQKTQFKEQLSIEINNGKPRPITTIERLPILSSLLPYEPLDTTIPANPIIKKIVTTKWQVELGGGFNWWTEGWKAQGNIDPINTPQLGWQLNARINRDLTKFLSIKLGLQFQNLRYKSAFEHTSEVAVYQPNTADAIFINSLTGAQRITYRDSIPGLQNRKFQNFNQHKTIQLPILAGFRFGQKRWKYAVHTGVSLQFFQQSSGRIALAKGSVIDLPNKNIYPTTFKISYLVEAQLAYQVTNKLSIFNRWSMERSLTDWLSVNSNFQQRPVIGASTFGLAWSF